MKKKGCGIFWRIAYNAEGLSSTTTVEAQTEELAIAKFRKEFGYEARIKTISTDNIGR
jgi:hypothetical protein